MLDITFFVMLKLFTDESTIASEALNVSDLICNATSCVHSKTIGSTQAFEQSIECNAFGTMNRPE